MTHKELLAVIVILAIIALIATPLVLSAIDKAKKGTFQSTAYGLISSAEHGYYMKQLSNISVKETVYEYNNGIETKKGEIEILYKGQKPKNGVIVINEYGKVGVAIDNGIWCAIKEYSQEEVTLTKLSEKECVLSDVPEVSDSFDEIKGVNKPILSTGMRPIKWNGDQTYMPYITTPWFRRGGSYSNTSAAGLFGFGSVSGATGISYSFRPVVVLN